MCPESLAPGVVLLSSPATAQGFPFRWPKANTWSLRLYLVPKLLGLVCSLELCRESPPAQIRRLCQLEFKVDGSLTYLQAGILDTA